MTAGPFAGRTMITLAARADVAPNHQVDARRTSDASRPTRDVA